MLAAIITLVFLAIYALLLIFYGVEWRRAKTFDAGEKTPAVFLSVVIAARNEEGTLPLLLQDIWAQSCPRELFEVIVVNDHSTDRTAEVIAGMLPNLSVLSPSASAELSSKKIAIATGVAAARGELIVTTDADCRVGPGWLQTIAAFYENNNAAFIAAPVRFTYDHSIVQRLQAMDFLMLQGITASSVASGFHNMCNGANLAYKKEAFQAVNGFAGIDQKASGDDMLLMHKIAEKFPGRVHYLKSEDAIVTTAPMPDWKQFFAQRKRWASKTFLYTDYRIIGVLGFVFLFNLLFWFLLVATIIDLSYGWLLLLYLFGKTLIELPFFLSVARFYHMQKLAMHFWWMQPLHIFYTTITAIVSQFGRYEWKGRKVR